NAAGLSRPLGHRSTVQIKSTRRTSMPDKTDKDGPFPAAASTSESSSGTPDLREIEFERIQRKDSNVGPNEAKQVVILSWDDFDTFFNNKTVDRPAVDF